MKNILAYLFKITDIILLPFLFFSGLIMKFYRTVGSKRLTTSTNLLKKIGVFPIRDHYYEPLFKNNSLNLSFKRNLPGINLNIEKQIKFLDNLIYQSDFETFINDQKNLTDKISFKLSNNFFSYGDAEFLFNFIRYTKPQNIIEVGSGESTKVMSAAITFNQKEILKTINHVCIEPFEHKWLENFSSISLERKKIEELNLDLFQNLTSGDLLFIDSSHIIRPQGDVIFELLEIIPSLKKGVYVHIHDIFTPHDYPEHWLKKWVTFWNEQYLLESTLSNNSSYEIIASLNYLKKNNFNYLQNVCPSLKEDSEPSSFYFQVK